MRRLRRIVRLRRALSVQNGTMSSPDKDLSRALLGALVLAAAVLLVLTLKLPGLLLSVLLVIGAILMARRVQADPEALAIRSSLQYARDDIAEVLAAYDQLQPVLLPPMSPTARCTTQR